MDEIEIDWKRIHKLGKQYIGGLVQNNLLENEESIYVNVHAEENWDGQKLKH